MPIQLRPMVICLHPQNLQIKFNNHPKTPQYNNENRPHIPRNSYTRTNPNDITTIQKQQCKTFNIRIENVPIKDQLGTGV